MARFSRPASSLSSYDEKMRIEIGQRVLEAVGVVVIAALCATVIHKLGTDSTLLATAVGAIVFIITRKRYKR